jgi:uncharacterized membrane protein
MSDENASSIFKANQVSDSNQIKARITPLDGIRGLAIILVMLDHFSLYGGMAATTGIDKWYHTITLMGSA